MAVRRGRRTVVPAHVHSPAQRFYHLRLVTALFDTGKGRHSPAFAFIHMVDVPNLCKTAPALDQRAITGGELRFLGSLDLREFVESVQVLFAGK